MIKLNRSRLLLATVCCSLALGGCAHSVPGQDRMEGEARLAKLIEGKVAGEPRSCIPARINSNLTIIDETALVYDAGNTVYVARPENPSSLDSSDILVIERFGSQICSQDIIRTIDRSLGFTTGAVFLNEFVPYKNP